jgi:hypothetical protein
MEILPSASFSSLEQLFFKPFHGVLRDLAALRTSALPDLPDDFRLMGNLAHLAAEPGRPGGILVAVSGFPCRMTASSN